MAVLGELARRAFGRRDCAAAIRCRGGRTDFAVRRAGDLRARAVTPCKRRNATALTIEPKTRQRGSDHNQNHRQPDFVAQLSESKIRNSRLHFASRRSSVTVRSELDGAVT